MIFHCLPYFLLLLMWDGPSEDIYISPETKRIDFARISQYLRSEGNQTINSSQEPSVGDLDTYRDAVKRIHDSVRKIYIEFSYDHKQIAKDIVLRHGLTPLPDGLKVTGKGAFQKLLLFERSSDNHYGQQYKHFVFDGTKSYVDRDGVAFITPGRMEGNFMRTQGVLMNLFLFVLPDDRLRHDKNKRYLAHSIDKYRDYLTVLPFQEEVNGVNCDVLNFNKMMFVWFESEAPFRLMRLGRLTPPRGDSPGGLKRIFEFSDFKTIDEITVPTHSVVYDYGTIPGDDYFGLPESERTYCATELKFDVDPELFEIVIPGNTEVHDSILRRSYITPADVAMFDQTIEEAAAGVETSFQLSSFSYVLISACLFALTGSIVTIASITMSLKRNGDD